MWQKVAKFKGAKYFRKALYVFTIYYCRGTGITIWVRYVLTIYYCRGTEHRGTGQRQLDHVQ
jgi:hypothetical protein